MKELRFHPQYRTLLFSTAADSFNIFRPNLEPDEQEEVKLDKQMYEEETKQESTTSSATSKPVKDKNTA